MLMNKNLILICALLTLLLFTGCGNGKSANGNEDKMSEMEQLKYDNTTEKLKKLYAEAATILGNESEMRRIREEIRLLKYDFNGSGMGPNAQKRCSELKERVNELKKNPDAIFGNSEKTSSLTSASLVKITENGRILISQRNMEIAGANRFPYSFNKGDVVKLEIVCQGTIKTSFYDINRQERIRQWSVNSELTDSVSIKKTGIYMIEFSPANGETRASVKLSYKGSDNTHRPHVSVKTITCKSGDFLAEATDFVDITPVFSEPKKLGLRGNLKSAFSGKSRALVSIPVPAGCNELLYSMRVSTNENTVSTDGKFPSRISESYKQVKLFGINAYERTKHRGFIDRILGDTRPPREEDAFCNMYVFTNSVEAKKFQDGTSGSGNYKYDVEQSQIGTQSCNGKLIPSGGKTIYIGFENERMRYDNYIWIEVVAIKYTKKYERPVYQIQ